jgi:FMN-dependent oxidoreductase (nitrilotriacetate monooxygenase family)
LKKQIRLNLIFHTSGRHDAGWKTFDDPTILIDDVDHQIEFAKLAEEAKFDAIFLPDTPAVLGNNFLRKPRRGLDPQIILAAIAMHTKHLGLISTAPSLHGHPYFVARSIASLHHVSKGRAGWNIVTSQDDYTLEALGKPPGVKLDREERYQKASESVEIVTGLWDSLPRTAITADKERDVYIDPGLTHPIDFQGKYYSSKGVLQLTGRYQGERPLLFQAGISTQSRKFGSKFADALFTSQPNIDKDRELYAEVKKYAEGYGRNPDHLVVLPGLYAVVAESEAEARKLKANIDELMDLNFLINQLAGQVGIPVEELDPHKPLPVELFDKIPTDDEVIQYRRNDIGGVSQANGFSVKQLVHHNLTRGQRTIFGTPEQIADTIEDWADTNVGDGFNVNAHIQPFGVERFKDVITELQNRGRYRKEYEHNTFRENYGLPPSSGD